MTNAEQATGSIERRHDLDALRAFAMLLGIVLHGALAFIPGAWVVSDASVEGEGTPYAVLVAAIHGFRMPVFFLMSGFFTAMLWRQRGLQALVTHRARRVLLPLVLAMIVVIPLTWAAWGYAENASKAEDASAAETETVAEDDVWRAAARGDVAALERHAAEGAPVDVPDPVLGTTPLAWAALHGHAHAAEWLLDNGAGVHTLNGDGSTALHSAAFMGRAEVVRLMLERGADPHARHPNGALPLHSSLADPGTTAYYVGLLGLSYEQAALDAGRAEVVQLLTEAMERPREAETGARTEADEEADATAAEAEAAGGTAPYRSDPHADVDEGSGLLVPWYWEALYWYQWGGLFTYDVFSHLWFLWYLVWLVGAFALIVWVASRLGLSLSWLPDRLVVTPALYLWAVPVTMATQYFMGVEGNYAEFGADTFTGLLPAPHVLVYYAVFFAFGAVYFSRNEGGARIGRWWQATLPLALVVLLAGLVLTFPEDGGTAEDGARWGSLFFQAAFAWMMALGLMGLFRSVLGAGNARVRYLSDASYWLYLMHLPLIIALQGLSFEWALPAVVKLVLLIAVTTVVLLVVYEWGVRYTPVGTLLNGRRRRAGAG
ncbi:MAG: acyltransferase family protein [Chloroflexota bacterium]|nr:acyltransferase family protein [Chloroflexota bacterium]MDE2885948.1 acyltransferase family protein [Chloroflexota bacterium]